MSLRFRVHKVLPGEAQGPAVVFEAAPYAEGDTASTPAEWSFVRIASLRSGDKPWRMGPMSFAPVSAGCTTTFHHIRLGPKEGAVHSGDASEMT